MPEAFVQHDLEDDAYPDPWNSPDDFQDNDDTEGYVAREIGHTIRICESTTLLVGALDACGDLSADAIQSIKAESSDPNQLYVEVRGCDIILKAIGLKPCQDVSVTITAMLSDGKEMTMVLPVPIIAS